jgi:hypothetical protein
MTSCSARLIKTIRSNPHYFGNTKVPSNGGGRPRSITPPMLVALCDHLLEKPDQYLDKMVAFSWDEFEVLVTPSAISSSILSRLSVFGLGKTRRGGEDVPTRTARIREGMRTRVYINTQHGHQLGVIAQRL